MLGSNYFLIAFLVTYARGMPVYNDEINEFVSCNDESRNSTPAVTCHQMKEASGYALSIDADDFRANEAIKVKVYRTSCPMSSESSLPRWYQLEAYWNQKNSTKEEIIVPSVAGRLEPMVHYRTDFYQCDTATKVLFYPCEAVRYDFPGRYAWKSPHPAVSDFLMDSVCFRLTVSEEGSTSCETIEKCIGYVNDSSVEEIHSIETLEDFDIYTEGIDDDIESVPDNEDQKDIAEEIIDLSPVCLENQKYYKSINSSWIPQCDCQGHYHAVQCKVEPELQLLTCWCSSQYGAQMSRPTIVDCANDSPFELSCVPAPIE